jgi:site-specific recombinase XerD
MSLNEELIIVITLDNQSGNLTVQVNNDIAPESFIGITRIFMSSRTISRTGGGSAPTLADLLATLEASELPERKRQELASAVRTAARALGKPPPEIPADGRLLGNRLKEVGHAAIGISQGRWNNVRCLLRTSLALIQPMSPGRNRNSLLPEWATLSSALTSRSDKIGLSRVLRFLSARGIGPDTVTAETIEAYYQHLHQSLLKRPSESFAMTVRAWRRAEVAIPEWPHIEISIPDRRRRWVSKWDRFPDSLRLDCQKWCDRLAHRDLLDDDDDDDEDEDRPFRPVRPATLAHREWQIRAFASALVRMGRDPATLTSLADLVELDAFKLGLRFFLDREGGKPTTAIADLASTLKAVARHYVRVENACLKRMAKIIKRLSPGRRGLTATNSARLRPFDEQDNVAALLTLPQELMRQARRSRNAQRGAVRAQMAAAIEILSMAPIRIDNLVSLDIERHLVRPGQSGVLHIVIDGEEVKNEEPLEHPLPSESTALIDCYIQKFRPHLAPTNNTSLFPGINGGPKNKSLFGEQISRTTRAHTGLRVHPHLFRHITAKLHLDAHPGEYETVRRVHGHRSIRTTTNFYCGQETKAAVRHFDQTILNLRRKADNMPGRKGARRININKPEKSK